MKRFNWLLIGLVIICLAAIPLAGCGVSKSEYEALQSKYDELNANYATVDAELAKIKEVYPTRYFNNYNELKDWVDKYCPIAYSPYNSLEKHLDLQQRALADGYIWSVYIEPDAVGIISCVVAGDSLYYVGLDGYIKWACWR